MTSNWQTKIRHNSRALFNKTIAQAFAPRRVRKPSDWAVEERRIEVGQSPLSSRQAIRYSHHVMPHCVEPMDAADDPSVNMIVLWFHRRGGKTEAICGNIIGRTVTDSPGNIFSMWPIEKSMEKFSRDTINPMIEATPILKDRFTRAKSRDAGRTKAYLRFAGGSVYLVFAGTPSATRGMAAKIILLHEIDDPAYAEASGGDIIERALGRGEGFGDAIKIVESTGTFTSTIGDDGKVKYRSRIAQWHDRGDKRKWFCPCHRCGKLQWLKFNQIVHPLAKPEAAEYLCEYCAAAHIEMQWREMVLAGKWFPTAGLNQNQLADIETHYIHARAIDPVVRSYWINGFNSLLPKGKGYETKLHQFVVEAARAKESPKAHMVWVNEVASELWNPDEGLEPAPDWKPLYDRREDYATEDEIILPEKALVITSGMDVHPNRIELSWWGWGRRMEGFAIDHMIIDGEINRPEVWDKLDAELQREFKHESGGILKMSFGLIDAGHGAEQVLRWLARHSTMGKVRACRGASKFPHPLIDNRYKTLAGNLRGHWIGTDVAKDIIYSRLRLIMPENNEPPTGWMHFGKNLQPVYFEQLCSERVTTDGDTRRYENEERARNETLDCAVYAFAAFARRHWSFDLIEKELRASAETVKAAKEMGLSFVPKVKPKSRMRHVSGLI